MGFIDRRRLSLATWIGLEAGACQAPRIQAICTHIMEEEINADTCSCLIDFLFYASKRFESSFG